MVSAGLQIFGIFLASIGFAGDIIVCALPMWKVSAFVGHSIMTAQIFWEGLWMNCVKQSTGQLQCKFYTSMLALPQELQAARALVVISIIAAFLGLLLAVAGGKYTNCVEDDLAKCQVAIIAGVFFIVGGILCLIPVSWSANEIIKTFYNPAVDDAQKSELIRLDTMGTQLVGFCLAIIGFMGTILICALPMWKVTAFVGTNIVTAQVFWEGLWMNCVIQSTGHLQCKAYDSVLALSQDLQGSRALVCVSLGVSVVAIGLSIVGIRCTNFCRYDRLMKSNIGIGGGVVFLIAGVLCIIPVSWSAHIIITEFNSPVATEGRRGELGASIYIGWASGALLVIGGGILTGSYRC
ncbi:claudin-like protein ZF-A89 [Gambusia affinis]|uniref:claudin-like protein ZF-A89 n=1 Tax=Gambusia affinis TaxID=33528 RepID=UPI001CDD00E4|nr:claudin-like protein ZF-A89 [Gambusia affinis]